MSIDFLSDEMNKFKLPIKSLYKFIRKNWANIINTINHDFVLFIITHVRTHAHKHTHRRTHTQREKGQHEKQIQFKTNKTEKPIAAQAYRLTLVYTGSEGLSHRFITSVCSRLGVDKGKCWILCNIYGGDNNIK
jgi:hypothetical protein